MAHRFQKVIHLISTDPEFRQQFISHPQLAVSDFDLQEEEVDILLTMHRDFLASNEVSHAENGPFGWNLPGVVAESGPFGWNLPGIVTAEQQAAESGPFGWNLPGVVTAEQQAAESGPFGWNLPGVTNITAES